MSLRGPQATGGPFFSGALAYKQRQVVHGSPGSCAPLNAVP